MAVLGGVVSAHAPSRPLSKIAYCIVFVILGCVAVVFVIKVSRDTEADERELNLRVAQLGVASAETTRLQKLNNELEAKVLDLANGNELLAKQNIATVTGGKSFCYMDFIYQFGGQTPVILHSGRYPIYDLNVRIVDLNKAMQRTSSEAILGTSVWIGELQVGGSWANIDWSIPFTSAQSQDFNVFFSARNGIWTEKLRLRRVNDHWSNALQVWFSPLGLSKPPTRPVLEKVAKDFPRKQDGRIDWDAPSK
jgi:hypothetical protein